MSTRESPENLDSQAAQSPNPQVPGINIDRIVELGSSILDKAAEVADPFDETFDLKSARAGLHLGASMARWEIMRKMQRNLQETESNDGNS